jgi:hypothetical protein
LAGWVSTTAASPEKVPDGRYLLNNVLRLHS